MKSICYLCWTNNNHFWSSKEFQNIIKIYQFYPLIIVAFASFLSQNFKNIRNTAKYSKNNFENVFENFTVLY